MRDPDSEDNSNEEYFSPQSSPAHSRTSEINHETSNDSDRSGENETRFNSYQV